MEKEYTPSVEQIIKRVSIDKLDDITVYIYNGHFSFMYTLADSVLKDEFKGKYEYVGGLQCNYENDSEMYNALEKELRGLAKRILNK